jgi:hypothetical protein
LNESQLKVLVRCFEWLVLVVAVGKDAYLVSLELIPFQILYHNILKIIYQVVSIRDATA